MSNQESCDVDEVNRRDFAESISALVTASIAGCGNIQEETMEGESPSKTGQADQSVGENPRRNLEEIEEEINGLYDRLADLPVVEGDEFVFEVSTFENDFDQKRLISGAKEVLERFETRQTPVEENPRIEAFQTATELTILLARQRAIVHQIIAAGFAYERGIIRNRYREATGAIRDGRQFLVDLQENGELIEEKSNLIADSGVTVDGYQQSTVENAQRVIAEIVRWTESAYEGLHYAVKGLRGFNEGNGALGEENYEAAGTAYQDSGRLFEAAVDAFERAQGTGRRLHYVAPTVDGMRCMMPPYLESCSSLRESMAEFQAGDEERARKIAREAFASAEQKASRCY